ncbi:hypothetical protein LAZ67_4002974 [Cordylochernes scorpioides]|uniref:Reverse transcriptase domain-containing protein n=1 Tax=Cordylochernes scorpioides TaxID=51811 RepID=A0ABY6KE02_9ARAC|nr:hypothetical protein LAZ67_4002974 [Cordylochernes scorpioides]
MPTSSASTLLTPRVTLLYQLSGCREFLAAQLRSIGLPQPFLEWLHLLYAEADVTIKVNGNFTRPFKMRKGLRQGCTCSAALFSIFTGPLLRHLERALGRGNVLAYADDILLPIREDWQFEKVKTIFDEFRRASGVCVNFTKSQTDAIRLRVLLSSRLASGYRSGLFRVRRWSWITGHQDSASACLLQGGSDRTQGWRAKRLLMAGGEWSLDGTHGFGGLVAATSCRLLELWEQASPILGLNHRVVTLVGACRFLATPSLRAPSRCSGIRVRDLAGTAPSFTTRVTRNTCDDAAALVSFCRRLVAENAESSHQERSLEEAVVLRGTATPFLRISTRTVRRILERPRLAAVPISRYIRRWAPVVDVPSTSLAFSSLRRCSFGGHAADITCGWPCTHCLIRGNRRQASLSAPPATPATCRWPTATGPVAPSALSSERCSPSSVGPRTFSPGYSRTISRRLVANGLHSCRPPRRLPLTPPNRRQRLEWCRARSTWMTEWHRVVFSDESRFCLSSDSRRVRVWRRRGERSNPAAIVERPTVRQRGIMVWGAIAYDSRSPLLRIQGTMTAQRYVDDVLRPVTLPYLQGVPNALYQQDKARPHTARISQQALQDVQMLLWPPYSPDLSPIEHVWDIIGRRLHALPQPRSEDELWQMHLHQNATWKIREDKNFRRKQNLFQGRTNYESTPQAPVIAEGNNVEQQPGTGKPSTSWADLVEQGKQLPMEEQDDGFILVNHERKRPAEAAAERQRKRGRVHPGATKPTVPPLRTSPECREFSQAQYFMAVEAILGKGCVYQLSKMEGHILVGLSNVQLAERLIEEGLDIEEATLRAFPLRKKAERIAVGNVPFFVTDADLIAALKPFGRVISIVQQMMELANSCWADARREAFITLNDGVRLSQIPARLEIKAKGMISPVYVSYGIRCSLCHRQGHKRDNCTQKTGMTEDKLLFPERPPVARPNVWSKPLDSSSQTSPAADVPPPPPPQPSQSLLAATKMSGLT